MQFDQKVEQYHLADTNIVITKSDFLWVTSGDTILIWERTWSILKFFTTQEMTQ